MHVFLYFTFYIHYTILYTFSYTYFNTHCLEQTLLIIRQIKLILLKSIKIFEFRDTKMSFIIKYLFSENNKQVRTCIFRPYLCKLDLSIVHAQNLNVLIDTVRKNIFIFGKMSSSIVPLKLFKNFFSLHFLWWYT